MSRNKTGYDASKFVEKGGIIGREWRDFKVLMRSVPCAVVALFAVAVVLMNLLANKEIHTGVWWLALDGGLTVSWLSFLVMDIITKRFGPKASVKISAFAASVNLLVCIILLTVSKLPGNWGAYYDSGLTEVNTALDSTFGGTWYVLFGSTVAFLTSAVANAVLNASIGRLLDNSTFASFAIRSYISTLLAQFVDNIVFTMIVSHVFFGWTTIQCIACALTGCVIELVCEVVFSPIGYKVSKQWEAENVGREYLDKCE